MPPVRHADPPGAVHEPLVLPVPALPARSPAAWVRSNIIERLKHFIFVRHGRNWLLFFRFGLVGASGVVVNLLVAIICKKIGPDEDDIFLGLPLSDFNIRWYHVYSTIAFLVANLWNFQLNRQWTFRSAKHSGWFREYFPFLAVGVLGQLVGLGILDLPTPRAGSRPAAARRVASGRTQKPRPTAIHTSALAATVVAA